MIAATSPPPIASFDLSPSEEVYFRARSGRIVDKLAHETSTFKSYYALPIQRPFKYVIFVCATMVATALLTAGYLYRHLAPDADPAPIFTGTIAVVVAAVGWAVSGGITHRNTIRQNTNNVLFARFSNAPFGEAVLRFYVAFGNDERITSQRLNALRASGTEDDRKTVAAVGYVLNYYEFIAAGVLSGDLNADIIRTNIRGVICYFYDRCEPHITASNKSDPKTFENLIKIRTHYRDA
jgi:hypothetical protein